jgi:membrane protein YqaA with SNARE-associated domain
MRAFLISAVIVLSAKGAIWSWIHRFGAAGLVGLGIVDSSVVPLPGSLDLFTILLTAHKREWWPIYGLAATLGAVIGGYLTYRIAAKGGKETLEKKIGKQRAEKVYEKFEKHGGLWIVLGSMLPPPFPIVPVLMAPGVLQYPKKKFLAALAAGRGVRFMADAYVAHLYGRSIIGFFSQYYRPMLYAVIALGVAGGIGALLYLKWYRPRKKKQEQHETPQVQHEPEHKAA